MQRTSRRYGHPGHRERRRWLVATALLAGGTGVALGSALAVSLAGTAVLPLVWGLLVGRTITTGGALLVWTDPERRSTLCRAVRSSLRRTDAALRCAHGQQRLEPGRTASIRARLRRRLAKARVVAARAWAMSRRWL